MRKKSSDVFALRKKTAVKILLKSLIWAFALFGLLFILLLTAVFGLLRPSPAAVEIPKRTVLMLNLDDAAGEVKSDNLLTEMASGNPLSFTEMLMVLEAAAFDERVQAVAARIHDSRLGLAQMYELNRMISLLRGCGKKTYVFAPGFGSLGGGTDEYFLASAFDEISMMPNTELGLTGISAEVPFFRGALDKIGVKPEFYARYEYKGGMASFTDSRVPPAFKENMNDLLASLNMSLLDGIAGARFGGQNGGKVLHLTDEAPLTADKALELGLIDKIEYESDWIRRIEKAHDAEAAAFADYALDLYHSGGKKKIAVIIMEGMIVDKPSSPMGESEISVPAVLSQLDDIAQDKDIAGILLRINSPGGSYNASHEIWHALSDLKEKKNIPLVVSMGDYAASGGYFIALAADKIFASPVTITGSVGVFGGKFVLQDMWEKLHVNWERFDVSENSGILSPNFGFSQEQRKVFEASLDRVYGDFAAKVATSRKIKPQNMDTVARGRVWSGQDALSRQLTDEAGGFRKALAAVKDMAGIKEGEAFGLEIYPRPKTLQEKLSALLNAAPVGGIKITGEKLGIDSKVLNMLQRLQYEAVLPPVILQR